MTVLIFFAVLFVLVLVHEWGHFIVAKKTGMRVDEFGIGFPPKLFGIKKGETEYTINLLPIGGFVRIFGEDGAKAPSARLAEDLLEQSEKESPASGQSRYGKNADDAAHSATEGGDITNSFTSKSKWAQVAVLLAGVSMNIIFAWFLFAIVFMVGVPTAIDENLASSRSSLVITEVLPNSPASEANIPAGAKILSYTNARSDESLTPTGFREYSAAHQGEPMQIEYVVGKNIKTFSVIAKEGLIADDASQPAIVVALAGVENVQKPFLNALYEASTTTINSLVAIVVGISKLLFDIVHLHADFSQVAGPIGIVGLVGEAAGFGLTSLLMFTAVISLNLAVINLLPFPALDGGRLLFVAIEAVMRRPINPVWVSRLNTTGFALLILLMVAVTYHDIAKLIMH